jgi:hypothetical protein
MKSIAFTLCAIAFALTPGALPEAHSEMGELKTPRLIVKGQPETDKALQKILLRPDAKYLHGHWVNFWTSLRYGGDTTALNLFVEELSRCPGLTVSISFQKLENDASWLVGQLANDSKIQVIVNLSSPQIEVERISLPAWTGRAPAQ